MSYGIELKEILDRCNLSEEEREKFEYFMDSRVIKNEEAYPNKISLEQATANEPLLGQARRKIKESGEWGKIIKLFYKYH